MRPNPSLQLSPNGGPPGPDRRYAVRGTRYAVRGTFSPVRARRPTVSASLARTLGIANNLLR